MFTNHGLTRIMERADCSEKYASHLVFNALKNGREADCFCCRERTYLKSKEYDDCHAIVYDGFCFIFNSDNSCVTMYPLPCWFGKKVIQVGKKKIRNKKKYFKYSERTDKNGLCKVYGG